MSQEVYESECVKQTGICILNFLPNIYDSNAKERTRYIDTVKGLAKANRGKPIKVFWLQAGDQLTIERQLGLEFGFPASLALSPTKKKYAVMRGTFSADGVKSFVERITIGKEPLQDLRVELKFSKVDKWDGKDAAPIEEEPLDV